MTSKYTTCLLCRGSLVAAVFVVGMGSVACTPQPKAEPTAADLRAENEQLKAEVARLTWQLKQATEELPEWSEYQ